LVKRNNCGKALEHARRVLDILGGNACADEYVIRFALRTHTCNDFVDSMLVAMSPTCKLSIPMKGLT
jgi:hypothetical protein